MFWALFDQLDLADFDTKDGSFEITQETGRVLFAFYSICAIMVALNMLIAMMTHSYDSISVRKMNLFKNESIYMNQWLDDNNNKSACHLSTGLLQVGFQDFLSTNSMQVVETTCIKSVNIKLQYKSNFHRLAATWWSQQIWSN